VSGPDREGSWVANAFTVFQPVHLRQGAATSVDDDYNPAYGVRDYVKNSLGFYDLTR
jgi:broad specificity polyphosphatase/5'/3'-nucleotidase SurE